ncbi:two-component sensor histidine kinase [Brachybacterium avium]|uniref:histidine kinase n=1 Tax=Brachybacterium avium TaxID=2017485 RepID=A0A220UBD0_9MICO|nr:PAS domain-containing sensor histidine kinase [Brachybacterium avium]ASK65518.1 two-component sensor histidine kinase [Brachybacterium avium]
MTLAVLVVAPHIATSSPHLLGGLGGILLLTAVAGTVPWQKFPPMVYWAIPLLDFVAIAPFWSAARHALDGMTLLSAFPVVWLAWSGIRPVLAITLGVLGSAAVAWAPSLGGPALFPQALVQENVARPAVIPFLMLALAIAASVLTRSMDRTSSELAASLENAAAQNRMLHTVVETSEVGILVVDGEGHDVLMNSAQRRTHFLGLPAGQADGAEAELLVFESDGTTPIPAEDRPVACALRGESFQGRIVAIGTDGSQQQLAISATPMLDADGGWDGSVVVFQNVTDLVGAIRSREQFVAEVSHEFRTPLTSIIGYLDLALDSHPDPVLERYLSTSIRNAERLLTLVSNLLDVSASTSTISVQDVDLVRLTLHSVESVEVRSRRNGVHLTSELPTRLRVRADAVKLGQVIDNLLSNAVKYTRQGGSVTVSLRRAQDPTGPERSEGGDWAELRVRDTGIGMTEDELAGLFQNFYRTEHVRKAAIPGTGLGLAISRGYVRAHGGEILVSSQEGVGSTFTVRLPVQGPAEEGTA